MKYTQKERRKKCDNDDEKELIVHVGDRGYLAPMETPLMWVIVWDDRV